MKYLWVIWWGALIIAAVAFGFIIYVANTRPVHAQAVAGIPCEEIRKLSKLERWYWVKRLELTAEQVRQIKKTCGLK